MVIQGNSVMSQPELIMLINIACDTNVQGNRFLLDFGIVPTVWYFSHLIIKKNY